jgi:hypothetical protein
MNTYVSGSLVRSVATFANLSGVATDPTTITFKYKQGGGTVTTVTYPTAPIVRDTTGEYHADLDTTGWTGPGNRLDIQEWIGAGVVQAIASDSYQVEPPAL